MRGAAYDIWSDNTGYCAVEYPVLTGIICLLGASVALLALVERLELPVLLAYLLVGAALGPSGLRWIPHTPDLHSLAELGVVLLLFTIGLEFPLGRLWTLRRHVFGLGGAQVVVTEVFGALLAWAPAIEQHNLV